MNKTAHRIAKNNIHLLFDAYLLGLWQLSPKYRTGIGRVCVELLFAFAKRDDVRVTLFTPNGLETEINQFLSQNNLPHLNFINTADKKRASFFSWLKNCARKFLTRQAKAFLKKLLHINPIAGYTKANDSCASAVADLLSNNSLFTSFWYFSSFYEPPSFLETLPKIKKAVFVHDISSLKLVEKQIDIEETRRRLAAINKKADLVFTNSLFTSRELTGYMPDLEDRVRTAYLACNNNFSQKISVGDEKALSNYGLKPGDLFFFSLCTLEPRKGLGDILSAYAQLKTKLAGVQFKLILAGGKGWKFEKIFEQAGSIKDVFMTGFIPDEVLPAFYRNCLAFLYMSEYEGFGLPVLEAMSCGAYVITSNASSIPEITGNTAVLLPPHDIEQLCCEMEKVLLCPSLVEQNKDARLAQSQKFSWDKCANSIIEAMLANSETAHQTPVVG